MSFLDRVLDPPSYGFTRDGKLYVPTHAELWREFFSRLNIFKSRKNWLALFSWLTILFFSPFFIIFMVKYFTWKLFIIGFIYSMVVLGTHGTVYLHRYGTHHAFTFANKAWLFFTRELVIKIVPEEVYMISHHVHHYISEKPGDPYNVHGGWLYCFLADVNHQGVAKDLTPEEYKRLAGMIDHTGIKINSYEQYQKWGSIAHPFWTISHFLLNWAFWGTVFYLLGGLPLLFAIFGWTEIWAVGIRTYNYSGHGGGKDLRREGDDFDRSNLSINQVWPGLVTGEWHNNHHLFPNGIRAGFQSYQWDYAFYYIWAIRALGGVDTWRDHTPQFYAQYYEPYLREKAKKNAEIQTETVESSH
jgi:stearoyl-CoA desaturase (delta-9 desaturase)